VSIERLSVEAFRSQRQPLVVLRSLSRHLIVLGSTQHEDVVALKTEVPAVRRRGGGGAVYVDPASTIWIDLWIPASDPNHRDDVKQAMVVIGRLVETALSHRGVSGTKVLGPEHRALPTALCFAGTGPGEVMAGADKLVGLTAWRGREGSLFQSAMYRTMPPRLRSMLVISDQEPDEQIATAQSIGLGDLDGDTLATELRDAFLDSGSTAVAIVDADVK
jgi:lipoate---protein ligase